MNGEKNIPGKTDKSIEIGCERSDKSIGKAGNTWP